MIFTLYTLTVFLCGRIPLTSSAACHPAPSLSASPSYPAYIRGESVTLTCAAPKDQGSMCSQQHKEGTGDDSEDESSENTEESEESNGKPSGKQHINYEKCSEEALKQQESTNYWTKVAEGTAGSFRYLYFRLTSAERSNELAGISEHNSLDYFEVSSEHRGHNFTLANMSVTDSGNYSCAFEVKKSKTCISNRSNWITISVEDFPPAPFLTVSPQHSVYIRGESVNMTCSVPKGCKAMKFWFYSRTENKNPTEVASQNSSIHILSTAHLGSGELYSCAYEEMIPGRPILSISSYSVQISVTDPLSAPTLSLQPPDGRVTRDGFLLLTCTAPANLKNVRIYFTNGHEMLYNETTKGSRSSVSYSFTPSPPDTISCYYEAEVQRRTLRSPTSNTILTTSGESGLESWLYYIIGGSLLFLLILSFILCCCLASRKGKTSFSSSAVQDPTDITDSTPMPSAISDCSLPKEGNYQNLYYQNRYCEPASIQPNSELYSTVKAPQPAPELYFTVKAPQPSPDLYSTTVQAPQPAVELYSTVKAPQPAPELYSTVKAPQPAAELYSTVKAPQPAPELYSTVKVPRPDPELYSIVNVSQPASALYSTVHKK
ncbi:Fc receptor-like protein 5 [Microcaecilia unicolor]|uniref:Fc receptor-like protein 5 n=1 Tax=Microcaecilia unicolor TaxID=1415580 RepID=A0A6P7WRK4_9AMPH|nr:Fc receptor-like protein 5 [Microcaecilia unicolor]XP_030043807.1 Fc receptor-like protein 5 [Microcaecilia unicolor]